MCRQPPHFTAPLPRSAVCGGRKEMVTNILVTSRQATEAHHDVLLLGAARLAWEYLRRDAAYRVCWHRYGRQAPASAAQPWGLIQLEDPRLDARVAHPVWDDRMPALLHIQAIDGEVGAGLDLWHIPGPKDVVVLPAGAAALRVRAPAHGATLRLRLGPGVLEGRPALCAAPLDTRLHARAAMLAAHAAHFAPRRAGTVLPAPCPANTARVSQTHL